MCYTGLGAALTARGYLAEADDRLSLAVDIYQDGSPSVWLAHTLILLAACRHAAGDNARAHKALDLATATLDRFPTRGSCPRSPQRSRKSCSSRPAARLPTGRN